MTGPFCLFLTGRRYWRYTGSRLDSGYPRPLPTNFSNVRAAFQWSDRGIYLFNRVSMVTPPRHTPRPAYPSLIMWVGSLMTGWGSLMTGLGSLMT